MSLQGTARVLRVRASCSDSFNQVKWSPDEIGIALPWSLSESVEGVLYLGKCNEGIALAISVKRVGVIDSS